MLVASLPIHRAVATSLLIIALISTAGTLTYLFTGRPLNLIITVLFVLGGLLGMSLGAALSRRLAGPLLQKLFAVTMVGVAIYILAHHAILHAATLF
jgi:uncharacterized membrane protein YfcA